ncbi:glycosyltransferase family 4 protein [Stutzerimonas xanthomarina]|uniref:Glycosyltransferase involved in cell wall bisynthesis n=2 Tax=Stutzerimonas xanthomarina TaxID=271420 RepID=A0A1M5KLX7_9GAMM|nr:glycosyltransferase family 4 protein [Stutzerimonas xanthomarina]MCP9337189.1 glycosyltransferase family 4 protein [Stutzerimonas xanthomarina]SEI07194.1 Glycosyltransferase involved in cell wall bisynthesis [Stutzerimonas xanthomarina]SHG53710.1 Glycosyltransferase involved in cell wall bisynthesis [Stutzerimonas xanthomarina DSM 18231]
MRKRILLLSFFYPPDLSAGSFRAKALVDALCARVAGETDIDVLTTQPNRYHSHASEALAVEAQGCVRIRRVQLPVHKSGFVDQAKAFAAFALQANRIAGEDHYDVVVATSSRLMTAVLGSWIARRQRARLYLDIRDIFVENLGELFPSPFGRAVAWTFGALERWSIKRADKVNLVAAGFLGYFQPKYPQQQFSVYTNGVDDDFVDLPLTSSGDSNADQPLRILYAGNIGDGQGLHLIIPALAQRLGAQVHFSIVGAGGRQQALRDAVAESGVENVELLAPVSRDRLLAVYRQADVLFLHLNDFKAFRRVLPSKLFEYAATGKPILAGVAGYASEFVKAEITNTAVFEPCDIDGALDALSRLSLEDVPRPEFVDRFARKRIMRSMADDVLELVREAI